jgi:hypothetical protein
VLNLNLQATFLACAPPALNAVGVAFLDAQDWVVVLVVAGVERDEGKTGIGSESAGWRIEKSPTEPVTKAIVRELDAFFELCENV